jgi:RNA polymerase sigma factor (sigma-70 family)
MTPEMARKLGRLFNGGPAAWEAFSLETDPDKKRNALDRIVRDNEPFIASCVRDLKAKGLSSPQSSVADISDDDLLQAGRRGYVKALERFDPEKGALPKYAKDWIRNEVQRTAGKNETIHKPEQIRIPAKALRKAEAVEAKTGRAATAEEMGLKEDALRSWQLQPTVTSLDEVGPSRPLAERMAVDEPNPETLALLSELGDLVNDVLTPKERALVRLMFWEGQSLEEAADELRMTVEDAHDIKASALSSLHSALG